jgi:hypothetical protein
VNLLHGCIHRRSLIDDVSLAEIILYIVECYERLVTLGKLASIGKEVVFSYMTILSWFSFGGTEEKYE